MLYDILLGSLGGIGILGGFSYLSYRLSMWSTVKKLEETKEDLETQLQILLDWYAECNETDSDTESECSDCCLVDDKIDELKNLILEIENHIEEIKTFRKIKKS